MIACPPAHVEPIAQHAHYAVYRRRGVVFGCHGARRTRLGTHVVEVRLAGRWAVIRRRVAGGRRLRRIDLRNGERGEAVDADRFLAVRADRRGLVAFVAEYRGRREVNALDQGWAGVESPAIQPDTLRLAAGVLAWRERLTLRLKYFDYYGIKSTPLTGLFAFRFSVSGEDVLASYAGGPRRALGRAIDTCGSSSGCGGIEAVQVAGAFLAARETDIEPLGGTSFLEVYDFLRGGAPRKACLVYGVGAYVITETGGVACATQSVAGERRIETADAVLDEGPGIDLGSLERRGDRIVWLHDGIERSATAPG